VPEGHVFPLYANKAATRKPVITFERPFLLYFEQSAAGLVVGSPVEFQGIRVGEVTDIRMVYDEELDRPVIPVRIAIQPQRVDLGIDVEERVQERWNYMIKKGLRAQLKSHNMLTGRMAVSLDFHPNVPPAAIDWSGPIPELPTVPGGMQQLLAGAEAFLARLNALPLDQSGEDLKNSVASLSAVMADAEQATPALAATLTNAEQALASANALIAPGSPVTSDLKNALRELARAARSLRLLADQLEAQPESLIRGKETGR
jgi:paraquat-inducible protein B